MLTTQQQEVRLTAIREARAVIATGKCPDCGAPLFKNNSLKDWWQCSAFPSPAYRRPEFEKLPNCNFQVFLPEMPQ